MPEKISPHDLQQFRKLVRPGFLLVLLLRMGELPSAYQIAAMLRLDRRTVARYLSQLVHLGYIQPGPEEKGYRLVDSLTPEQERMLDLFQPGYRRGV